MKTKARPSTSRKTTESMPASSYTVQLLRLLATLLLVLLCACSSRQPKSVSAPWPSSTPEEQGMDSEQLLRMIEFIEKQEFNLHSILILRHGKVVLELYYPPYGPQDKHLLFSATKSVTSALVGIAVQEGKIQSVDQKALDFFPERQIAHLDERKQDITVLDLLNMTSGLVANDLLMGEKEDWALFTLDQEMRFEPGKTFDYNTGDTQLLSAILQESTGMTALAYAQERLFAPLGIQDFYWPADASGVTKGGIDLMLTPRDMAKFGYLYLHQGKWDGRQVVPAEWVQESTRSNANGYAYQWWQSSIGFYAGGAYGQVIYVVPSQDLVAVFTSADIQGAGLALTASFIISAIKSDQALPESPATQKLTDRLAEIAAPKARPVPQSPATASSISGRTLVLEDNPVGWEQAALTFTGDQAWLTIKTSSLAEEQKFEIGLDGLYRLTPVSRSEPPTTLKVPQQYFLNPFEFGFLLGIPIDGSVAMQGKWKDDNTFQLIVQDLRDVDQEQISLAFTSDGAEITWKSSLAGYFKQILKVTGKFK